jgi:serine protease AprX
VPAWPGWDAGAGHQWHGLMTSVAAAGNGVLSHGLYRGLAADADLVLVRARGDDGHISNEYIARALTWLRQVSAELGVRVVSVSVGGDPAPHDAPNPVDEAVAALVASGVAVVAAAGNEGVRRLVPPATAPAALTVGGLDDRNSLDTADDTLWRGNFGESPAGSQKPEVVAPSLWVVAPVLPDSDVAREAAALFERRAAGDESGEARIAELKLVTPHYQHVEGTSFAAPIVAGVAAGMLQACPTLAPARLRELIVASARPVDGADRARQGAGVVQAGEAVALALRERGGGTADARSPRPTDGGWAFRLLDPAAGEVRVVGSWDNWAEPGLAAVQVEPGVWEAAAPALPPGQYAYKFRVDNSRWLADPVNPAWTPSPAGGWDSVLTVPA